MVVDMRLYNLLRVKSDAPTEEIKRAFKKLALRHHPDKGGDGKTFQELSSAQQILTDPHKRRIYDQFGEEGLRRSMQDNVAETDPSMLFGSFFADLFGGLHPGAANSRRRPWERQAPRDVVIKIPVSLQEMYSGATKKVQVERTNECAGCYGARVTKHDAEIVCSSCGGTGVHVQRRRFFQNSFQKSMMTCPVCDGNGRVLDPSALCMTCSGAGVIGERVELVFSVPPGAENGLKIRLSGEGNRLPDGMPPGDVFFVLDMAEHPRFTRNGNDLHCVIKIGLVTALRGGTAYLAHLDGRTLALKTRTGHAIQPGSIQRVMREGMPVLDDSSFRGDLLVRFDVLLPEQLNFEAQEQVMALVGHVEDKVPNDGDSVEERDLEDTQGEFWSRL